MLGIAVAVIVSGALDLAAIARGWTKARYVWKPLTMLLILMMAWMGADVGESQAVWILIGLVLSLAGDVFLVLPSDRFLSGLVAFLAAHLCYIVSFSQQSAGSDSAIGAAIALALFGLAFFLLLFRGVRSAGGAGLLVAVACYILVILVMVWSAVRAGDSLLLAGAVSFMVSDAILAWGRFMKNSLTGELAVMVTYYAAQCLIAASLFV
ncbi:putative membrane protein YhhN [Tumebacillus sp. BK434]|uniref:lysoplasmalogenase n=1 Tax=Tumebacillus sp. BK434 TaxID=2512169 RepID=UPI0010F3B36E|nr:lysoplasmalogenase [Tumebacillus sp. BK434]TCP53410.1 putative membrane protein YhhN [Tumebacillus sp. BK434]